MTLARRLIAPACAALLITLGGCGGGDRPTSPGPTQGPSETPPAANRGPAYDGPALPGLAARPVWSAPVWLDRDAHPQAVDLGDTVVVARDDTDRTTASPGAATSRGKASVLDFREIASGQVRTTVKLPAPLKDISRDTLHGKPVAVVAYDRVTPSDGLSAAKRVKVLEVYDRTGAKVGQAEAEGTFTTFAVVEGRVVRTPKAGAVSLTPLEGGSSTTVECGMPVCGFEATNGPGGLTVGDGSQRTKALLGDLAFTIERPSAVAQGTRLLAVDASTGQRRWTSSTIQAPAGTRGEDEATGVRASPIALVGGKLVLAWSGPGVNDRILALHDPATGRLVSTGPRLHEFPYIFRTDAKGETAVASSTASDARSAAWDLAAGKVLWEQAADEKGLEPSAVINGAVYGTVATGGGGGRTTIVVDLRTKKVLVRELALGGSVTPTSTGHGLVVRDETMYVFPAA
jgi:hypothetical protein